MRRLPNKKQRGQIIILMMFAIIPIFLLMATIFNGGYMVAQKTRLQNATDTSALMEASWTARSLNIMSMNNTAMTQSQAITSAGWAMEKPLLDAGLNTGLVAGFYVGRAFRVATMCPPYCYVLAPLVYGGLLAALNHFVMDPLYKIQEELKRAMHTDEDTGFAKAATSFGRMNRIMAEQFPDKIDEYSDTLLHANYSEAATLIRYTAWSDDPLMVGYPHIPVIQQSFRDAMENLNILGNGSSTSNPGVSSDTSSSLTDAVANIKDIRDVYNAGLTGTVTNPYSSVELNYFGNFRAQGYVDGTGPFNAAREELETKFGKIYTDLDGYITGSTIGDLIERVIGEAITHVIPDNFLARFIAKIVGKIVSAILRPLIGTAYESQETDPADFKDRLDNVWGWSSLYSETHYSNSWRVGGELDLKLFSIFAPARAWRGIAPGIYHGQDLTNLADGIVFDSDDAKGEVSQEAAANEDEFMNECVTPGKIQQRANQLAAERRASKADDFNSRNPKPTNPATGLEYTLAEFTELPQNELDAIEDVAREVITAECREEFNRYNGTTEQPAEPEHDLPDTDTLPGSEEEEYENQEDDYASAHADGATKSGSWNRPRPLQNFLEIVNWFFEPAYQIVKLPFPADAALFAFIGPEFIGGDRNKADPNWWCGLPFGEGFVCTNEAPLYAVRQQRILPQFAMDIANHLPLNELPPAIQDNYLADRNDWSVIVGAYAPAELIIGERGFGIVPTEMSTVSQAEVYNSQWFDLFTQTWKAKLTPVALLDDDDHYAIMTGQWQQENSQMVEALSAARHDDERVLNH